MDFLKHKFFDRNNLIEQHLVTHTGALKPLEDLPENIRQLFRDSFFNGLLANNATAFNPVIYNAVDETINPWSIDFPGWIGPFDPETGKKVFVIGSEPHIHHKYLQTVYGFHTLDGEEIDGSSNRYYKYGHPIFRYLPTVLSTFLNVPEQTVLEHCYLTDLVSFAPMKSAGKNAGSINGINNLIKGTGDWRYIRRSYASVALANEIQGVKPDIIVAQGKEVFREVCLILLGKEVEEKHDIQKLKGKQQYIRIAKWRDIPILSVPHIGSKRMRTFWESHLHEVKISVNKHL